MAFPATLTTADLIHVIERAGYTAALPAPREHASAQVANEEDGAGDADTLLRRLLASLALAIPVVVLAMIPALQFRYWQWVSLALYGKRVSVPPARQLKHPADRADRQPHCRLSFRPNGALDALDPGFCLLQLPLPGQHDSDYHACHAGGRLVGPAMLLGQLDRLPAPFRRPRKRPPALDYCQVT